MSYRPRSTTSHPPILLGPIVCQSSKKGNKKFSRFGASRSCRGGEKSREVCEEQRKVIIPLVITSFVFFNNCSDIAGLLVFSVQRISRSALVHVRSLNFYPVLRRTQVARCVQDKVGFF